MTLRISLVAVCCSSASVTWAWADVSALFFSCNSVKSRTFSMAMTAWSAKVLSSAISPSENGLTSARDTAMVPMAVPSRSIGTPIHARWPITRARCCEPSDMEHLSVDEEQRAVEPVAQPHGAPQDGIEHRLHVRRRLADHAEDLTSR